MGRSGEDISIDGEAAASELKVTIVFNLPHAPYNTSTSTATINLLIP